VSLGGRLSAAGRRTVCERLVAEVGGYLRNAVREPHVTCAVCATPIKPAFDLCLRCRRDQQEFGDALADLVVPVCYGIRGRQSGYLMHSYKDLEAPARHTRLCSACCCSLRWTSMEGASSTGSATASMPGRSCHPSASDRTGKHPLHVVAQRASLALPEIELVTGSRSPQTALCKIVTSCSSRTPGSAAAAPSPRP